MYSIYVSVLTVPYYILMNLVNIQRVEVVQEQQVWLL